MPIEIREVVIRAAVGETRPAADSRASGTGRGDQSMDKQALIQECVEKVMQILADKKAR